MILPGEDSVFIMSPVLHFERFSYGPAREKTIETQLYTLHLSELYQIAKKLIFRPGKQTKFLSNKITLNN